MASQDWFEKDFYSILGVSADADAAEIKKRYRKLARDLHPDANPGDTTAEQRFKEIGEAYAVLSDAEQRKQYDAVRAMSRGGARFTAGSTGGPGNGTGGFEDVFSQFFGGGGQQGQQGRFTRGPGGFGGTTSHDAPDLEDLLSMFGAAGGHGFPGGSPGGAGGFAGAGTRRNARKGRDVHATATLTFRQAVAGDTVIVNGVGGRSITARIPAGVHDGATIRLRGKGEPPMGVSVEPGDLLLKITVKEHDVFTRDGDNLLVDLPVTFAEAALGATVPVPTLDSGTVKVRITPGTPSGRVLRVKGRGVHRKDGTSGDLLAKIQVIVPQRLSDEAREAVETLQRIDAGYDPREELTRKSRAD
ncbi:molecular chaperone DnaJ [Austwickia chelonae]|uniref:Chaperone protein DnaJ n=1 Tax=Austwickia chelonae NBRC 105200 TaxID=1184607 RepID=K6VQ97_9MICO|nr:DnaJ C-terminal domain-containing protein [Austwickia chelonae]GAB78924.1 chaperone protein DnaJ [Austwickia chelonae NBRC 105200]SEV86657.1 molecular chaperone DnaJ [Austwickia chelonae]